MLAQAFAQILIKRIGIFRLLVLVRLMLRQSHHRLAQAGKHIGNAAIFFFTHPSIRSPFFMFCMSLIYFLPTRCCLDASASNTAAAVDTLKLLTLPYMGMDTITSLFCLLRADTPFPSLPKMMAAGPVKSTS